MGVTVVPKTIICPFWKWEGEGSSICEGCKLTFPDRSTRQEYIDRFCGSMEYRQCTIAAALMRYYDEKEG